jgi:hypothetical protein
MGQNNCIYYSKRIRLSVNTRNGKTPTLSHNILRANTHYLCPFPHPCPHVPYISGSEPSSLTINAHRWPQDEDTPDPAIHCHSWPPAICR